MFQIPWEMGATRMRLALAVGAALAGGCGDDRSATDLNPEGPPMVRQVFVQEKEPVQGGFTREEFRLAFGDHPDIGSEDDRVVNSAVALGGQARLRVVFDELLRGNDIEEIWCNDDTYSRIPVGTDPDDLERCIGADLSRCEAVCAHIGPDGPVGIRDRDGDGSVDDENGRAFRMIDHGDGELAASVVCDGERTPLIAQGEERSFYNPSGNQLFPADPTAPTAPPDPNGLGPALILIPSLGLRTGSSCTVAFPHVVDKDGNRVCAPPGGDIDRDCAGDGDTEEIQFQVEPLTVSSRVPDPERPGPEGVLDPENPLLLLAFVANIDPETLGAITLSTGGEDVPIEASLQPDEPTTVKIEAPGGFLPGTDYTITIGTGLADVLGGALKEPILLDFSTSGEPPADPAVEPPPDAGP